MKKQIDRLKLMGNLLRKTARQKGIKLIDIKIKNVKPKGLPILNDEVNLMPLNIVRAVRKLEYKQKSQISHYHNNNMKQQLKDLFWEWYYSEFAEEVANKEQDIIFRERHSEEILNKFSEQVGL